MLQRLLFDAGHEAYLRLVDVEQAQHWDRRGHFFAAAAEAMRRILVDQARRRRSYRRGGAAKRHSLASLDPAIPAPDEELLAVDEALERLQQLDPPKAEPQVYEGKAILRPTTPSLL